MAKKRPVQLLMPEMALLGLEIAFYQLAMPTCIGTTHELDDPKGSVGLVMIFLSAGELLGTFCQIAASKIVWENEGWGPKDFVFRDAFSWELNKVRPLKILHLAGHGFKNRSSHRRNRPLYHRLCYQLLHVSRRYALISPISIFRSRMHDSREIHRRNHQTTPLDSPAMRSDFRLLRLYNANVHQSNVWNAFSIWGRIWRVLRLAQFDSLWDSYCWIYGSAFKWPKISKTLKSVFSPESGFYTCFRATQSTKKIRPLYNSSRPNLHQLVDVPPSHLLYFADGIHDAKQPFYLINYQRYIIYRKCESLRFLLSAQVDGHGEGKGGEILNNSRGLQKMWRDEMEKKEAHVIFDISRSSLKYEEDPLFAKNKPIVSSTGTVFKQK